MDATSRAAHEAAIVKAVAASVTDVMEGEWDDREWLHLFVDFEIAADSGRSSSITFALARRPGGPVEHVSFRLPMEAKRLLAELADGMGAQPDRRWSTVQIRVARGGAFIFDYAYGPPHRLGGQLLDNRFKDYLDTWLASEEGAPHRPKARRWWGSLIGR